MKRNDIKTTAEKAAQIVVTIDPNQHFNCDWASFGAIIAGALKSLKAGSQIDQELKDGIYKFRFSIDPNRIDEALAATLKAAGPVGQALKEIAFADSPSGEMKRYPVI